MTLNCYHIAIVVINIRFQNLRNLSDFLLLCLVVYRLSRNFLYVKLLLTLLYNSLKRNILILLLFLLVKSLRYLVNPPFFTYAFVFSFLNVWFIFLLCYVKLFIVIREIPIVFGVSIEFGKLVIFWGFIRILIGFLLVHFSEGIHA